MARRMSQREMDGSRHVVGGHYAATGEVGCQRVPCEPAPPCGLLTWPGTTHDHENPLDAPSFNSKLTCVMQSSDLLGED